MEAVECRHKENVESTPEFPGIELGTCIHCGQVTQYQRDGRRYTATIIQLGRIDGKIVIPPPNIKLLLSDEDKEALKLAKNNQQKIDLAKTSDQVPPRPDISGKSKFQKTRALHAYYEANAEAIIADFHRLGSHKAMERWGFSGYGWKTFRLRHGLPLTYSYQYGDKDKESTEEGRKVESQLPPFPAFNDDWVSEVKIEWLRSYVELSGRGHER